MTDAITKSWTRTPGDERAAANGCRFDVLRGAWTVWWIERFCRLYEGEGYAGTPVVLHGCHNCDHSEFYATTEPFWLDEACTIPGPAQELHTERARLFAECIANGHHIDWQYECHMRLYGWVKFRERWGRECRRFRQGSFWVPKKQKKSPTLAANGMYLLAGDGEPGQKVFLAAKDGDQARNNAAKHTVEMLYQCPELYDKDNPRTGFCTLNRSTLRITHEPSRSVMYPLSSSNTSTQKSKEGLNGSVLIDETHVVDRAFVNIISRAGISRSEPLFLEFSTAGNDPDGYGKERFDYCQDVLNGTVTDEELFTAIYAAPQDVTTEQIDAEFDKFASMANPSLGHTIDPVELRADYDRSKRKIEDLCNCLMYRFNVWQQSANPWLRPSDWAKCAAEYTEADLIGLPCFGGLDLGFTDDMTALVLAFSLGYGRYRLWPYLFIPEAAAKKPTNTPWKTWEANGHIHFFGGDTTDFPYLRKFVGETLRDKFGLKVVAYDKHLAATLAQDLQDDYGLEMVAYLQSTADFAEPMLGFENDVAGQRLEHPGNPCLNWHARNATKNQRNGLLEKPGDRSKKIDGIVAAIMARQMAVVRNFAPSWSPEDGVTL